MSSQGKINAYMERHHLGPLFEDLMNKVLRDMPEEPMVYLLRTMYKKAGMEIPQGIRYGGLRKSTSEQTRGRSPERPVRTTVVSSSADLAASRDYEKPWATSPTRRTKAKKSDEPISSKQKPEWNADNKLRMSSFEEFWEGADATRKERAVTKSSSLRKSGTKNLGSSTSAWASVGLEDDGEKYTSPQQQGWQRNHKSTKLSEEELLALESLPRSMRAQTHASAALPATSSSGRYNKGRKMNALKQRQKMGQLLSDADNKSDDSGVGFDPYGEHEDDAIELLENADDLRREGVTNIPKSGYKLSKNIRYRENEPRVKVNINLNPYGQQWGPGPEEADHFFDDKRESSTPEPDETEDEEFESISQVTGPRKPVWGVPESDSESALRPSFSREAPRPTGQKHKTYAERSLYATTPDPVMKRSVESTEELVEAAKTWSDGVNRTSRVSFDGDPMVHHSARSTPDSVQTYRSESSTGGWLLPEDTEVASAHEWNQRFKGGPVRDPRAY